MADTSVPGGLADNPVDGDSRRQEAYKPISEFFVFRPFAFYRYAVEQAEKYNYEYDRHRHNKWPWRMWLYKLACNRWVLWAILVCVSIGLAGYYTWQEVMSAEQVVALFTGLLFIGVVVQFFATYLQWQAMQQQGKAIERQARLSQDALNLTQLQLRAWLHVTNGRMISIEPDQPIRFRITVANSGASPATITGVRIAILPFDARYPIDVARGLARAAPLDNRKFRVPPHRKLHFSQPEWSPAYSAGQILDFEKGQQSLYIAGVISYTDPLGNDETFEWVYSYASDSRRGLIMEGEFY